jgi:hypothetical protein
MSRSLAALRPDVADLWHPTLNAPLTPYDVPCFSSRSAYWQCDKGHEYEQVISKKTIRVSHCPICTNSRVLAGYNDLATTNPNVAAEWHPTRNAPLLPTEVAAGSSKKLWWQCALSHEWQTSVNDRNQGTNCPYCSNAKVLAGYNDLESSNATLAAEWHSTRNGKMTPSNVGAGSNSSVWWQCVKGHEWRKRVVDRNKYGYGCPYCANKLVLEGFNDFATTHPELVRTWHPSKNGALAPNQIITFGNRHIWWQCELGHEWRAIIKERKNGTGCPVCANRKLQAGFNDLQTLNPAVAAFWHPQLNHPTLPSDISPQAHKKYWWQCELGHEWKSTPSNRERGQGCPFCANQKVLEGFNDFASQHPELANEWHPTMNLPHLPKDVISGTHRRFWWKCEFGHEWKTQVAERVNGTGCPTCATYGFDPNKPAEFYFIENHAHRAYKLGITNGGTNRIARFGQRGWHVIHIVRLPDGHKVRALEAAMLTWIRQEANLPPFLGRREMGNAAGWTETFARDEIDEDLVLQKMRETCESLSIPFDGTPEPS